MEEAIRQISILVVPVLLAITFHELAHGWVADRLGDPTPRVMGRLSLNPLKHLDLVGTLVFFFTRMIGWAKPVPINPYNFRNPRKDMMWVALAGPFTNLVLAALSAIAYKALRDIPLTAGSMGGLQLIHPILLMARVSVIINVGLAIFNVIPVPPLDGSRVVTGLLPPRLAHAYSRIEPYGFVILILLIFTGVVDYFVFPVVGAVLKVFLGAGLGV